MKWVAQFITWGATIYVARILSPSDFGLIGMATVYLGLVTMINEAGLGTAIVMLDHLSKNQVAQINTLALLLGAFGFGITCLLATPLSLFYKTPALSGVVVVMSLNFIITAFRSVPYALLQRDLRFKYIAILEAVQVIFQAVTLIILVLMGFGYWALVFSSLVNAITGTLVACALRPFSFAFPRIQSLKEALTFSRQILVGRIFWYVYSNADFLVAGRFLGQTALGFYTFAWNLANMPIEKISALIGQVTPAFFTAVKHDKAALRRYLLGLTEVLCLATFPLSLGMGLLANDVILLLLGDKWRGAIIPFQLLVVYATYRSIVPLIAQIIIVIGETRFGMYASLAMAIGMPISFYIGSFWGTMGIAGAWILAHPWFTFPLYRKAFHGIGLSVKEYLVSIWPGLSSSLVMSLAVYSTKLAIPQSWPPLSRLTLLILTGIVTYFLMLLLFYRPRLNKICIFLKENY